MESNLIFLFPNQNICCAEDKNSTRPLVITSEIWKRWVNLPKALILEEECFGKNYSRKSYYSYYVLFCIYRWTSLCQTCLSWIHSICRSDHSFPSISPILLCISNLFKSNSVITKSRLYRSVFSFPKNSFPLHYHCLCRSKICAGQKIKQYECQTT